jgi:hypothetical protein
VFTAIAALLVVVAICVLGVFFTSSDAGRDRRPVITWLVGTLGLVVMLGVATAMVTALGRSHRSI